MSAPSGPAQLLPRIILIEDDAPLRAALRFALRAAGYSVGGAARAETLLEADFPSEPVCLIFDQKLPGLSGIEAIETLRARGVLAPIFLMTTQPGARLRGRAKAAGAEILEKPILGDQLVATLRALALD